MRKRKCRKFGKWSKSHIKQKKQDLSPGNLTPDLSVTTSGQLSPPPPPPWILVRDLAEHTRGCWCWFLKSYISTIPPGLLPHDVLVASDRNRISSSLFSASISFHWIWLQAKGMPRLCFSPYSCNPWLQKVCLLPPTLLGSGWVPFLIVNFSNKLTLGEAQLRIHLAVGRSHRAAAFL